MSNKLQVLDSHFHVWDLSKQNLPWLADTDGSITKTFRHDELRAAYAAEGAELVGSVYVEVDSDDPLLEDELAFAITDSAPVVHSVRAAVGPHARVPLGAHAVREPLHVPEKPKGYCLTDDFVAGIKALAKAGLPFDACLRQEELGDLVELVGRVPEETFIVDHMGNATSMDSPAIEALQKLGKFDNVVLKVSGFPTADAGFVKDLLTIAKESFSPKSLMFASNWPVVSLYSTFGDHLRAVREFFGDDPDLFVNNAARVYNVPIEENTSTRSDLL